MKLNVRFSGLLALLFVGSAGLQAQGYDPFPDVNYRLYQGNMTITARVMQNGEAVTDAVVAAFYGDEIRGKDSVGNGTNPSLVYLMVYGEKSGVQQELYFKVCTGGTTFVCTPDPSILFKNNDSRGTESEPYLIVLPVSLANDADNTATLTTYKGTTCDVVLTGRTLYKNGSWNTLCLPFDVSTASGPLSGDGVQAMTLDTAASGFSDGTLTLNFDAATSIPAGTPFIIKWDDTGTTLTDPVFTGVILSDATHDATVAGILTFTGTYAPVVIGSAGDNTKLYLGAASTLYWPNAAMSIGCHRAYFQLLSGLTAADSSSGANLIRQFVLNFGGDATGVASPYPSPEGKGTSSPLLQEATGEAYDLAGRRIDGIPTAKGIYIVNGHKVIVK